MIETARSCALVLVLLVAACSDAAPPAVNGDEDARGRIVSSEHIDGFTLEELDARLSEQSALITAAVEAEFGIDVYRVLYDTIDPHGQPTRASGVVAVPRDARHELPLLSYQHGTIIRKRDAPSLKDRGERVVALGMAGAGYLATAPDYLGLGLGSGGHPYIHAGSASSATLDMLRATRTLARELGLTLSGDVFLLGYSQGGHATMATAKAIAASPTLKEEFRLAALAPMAGPYSVSGVMADVILSDEPYPDPSYLPYLLLSYDAVYDFFADADDVFQAPYVDAVLPLFDGRHGQGDVNRRMPVVPKNIVLPEVLAGVELREEHPLRVMLRDNDVYDWTPTVPMRLYHCEADQHVAFANAEVAMARFDDRGATSVELVSMGAELDHQGCALPALADAKVWFDLIVRSR